MSCTRAATPKSIDRHLIRPGRQTQRTRELQPSSLARWRLFCWALDTGHEASAQASTIAGVRPLPDLPSPLPSGLIAVIGDEGTGKTRLLRKLGDPASHPQASAIWLDLALPGHDDETPAEVWEALRASHPGWQPGVQEELIDALSLQPHLDKQLFMLSTGSRRKVALVGLLSAGARVTCLDQPYAALDLASVKALREFLKGLSGHPTRTWVIADYEADPLLLWQKVIQLA